MRAAVQKNVSSRGGLTRYQKLFPVPQSTKLDDDNEKKSEADSGVSSASSAEIASGSSTASNSSDEIVASPADHLKEEKPVEHYVDNLTSKDLYDDNYGHYSLHELFLRDPIVISAFQEAIYGNSELFKDKVVLNIGCGVGTLALFAASVGASHVYAVENSSIINYAKNIVELNKKTDLITLIQGTVEQIDLPVEKVDVILCDWVGHALFFNTLIPSVLYARDKWLRKPGGVILPDKAELHIAGIENRPCKEWKVDWWNSVYDFNMSSIRDSSLQEPFVDLVDVDSITTTTHCLTRIDLNVMPQGTKFDMPFRLFVRTNSYLHAVMTYFDVHFSKSVEKVGFSTSPYKPPTNYAQTAFYLKGDLAVMEGETIDGRFTVKEITKSEARFDIQIDCEGEQADYHELNEFVMTHRRH